MAQVSQQAVADPLPVSCLWALRSMESWRASKRRHRRRLAKLTKLQTRHGRHPIRTIIDATSKSDRRSQSRWILALRYAYRKRKRWRSFERFLSNNGGISGCASQMGGPARFQPNSERLRPPWR